MTQYSKIIHKFNSKKILVIGDIVLDQYIKGSVFRISPEAPVPIVLQDGPATFTPGGAANVANNLKSLGAKVTLLGRIGKDDEGRTLLKTLKNGKINTHGIFIDPQIPTALKTRIVAHNQQVLRLDRERIAYPSETLLKQKVRDFIRKHIDEYDAIIISDYGKGMVSQGLVEFVCSQALSKKKIITVDPKVEHFSFYRGVTAITPNRKEAENAIRNIKITHNGGSKRLAIHTDKLDSDHEIDLAGQALLKFLNLESLLMTLGEQGMRLFERGKKPIHINTVAKEVFDVTGAGDTVISTFTLSLTTGATKHEAADLSNYAAGIVVGKMGPIAVTQKELLEATKK